MRVQSINNIGFKNNFYKRENKKTNNNSFSKLTSLKYSYRYIPFGKIQGVKKVNTMDNPIIEALLNEYKALPQVQSIAIGGSRATGYADFNSDIDIYVFTTKDIPTEKRAEIAKKYSDLMDIGQDYFGPDDEFFAKKIGKAVDVVYFDTKQMEDNVKNVWENHNASNGYTTSILFTLKNVQTFSDKEGWLQGIKDKLNAPYPKELKRNIINRNMQLLKDKPFASYQEQARKALNRGDLNSVNHRITAYMASYFDIIFAMNEKLNPGEKRLVQIATDTCRKLPDEFIENINSLYSESYKNVPYTLSDMTDRLKECLASVQL